MNDERWGWGGAQKPLTIGLEVQTISEAQGDPTEEFQAAERLVHICILQRFCRLNCELESQKDRLKERRIN